MVYLFIFTIIACIFHHKIYVLITYLMRHIYNPNTHCGDCKGSSIYLTTRTSTWTLVTETLEVMEGLTHTVHHSIFYLPTFDGLDLSTFMFHACCYTHDQGKEFLTNNIYFIPIKLKVFISLFIIYLHESFILIDLAKFYMYYYFFFFDKLYVLTIKHSHILPVRKANLEILLQFFFSFTK